MTMAATRLVSRIVRSVSIPCLLLGLLASLAGVLIGLLFLTQLARLPGWNDALKIVQAGFWVYLVGAIATMIPTRLEL